MRSANALSSASPRDSPEQRMIQHLVELEHHVSWVFRGGFVWYINSDVFGTRTFSRLALDMFTPGSKLQKSHLFCED